jgi:hypothetical protein
MSFLLKDPEAVLDYAIDWGAQYLGEGDRWARGGACGGLRRGGSSARLLRDGAALFFRVRG